MGGEIPGVAWGLCVSVCVPTARLEGTTSPQHGQPNSSREDWGAVRRRVQGVWRHQWGARPWFSVLSVGCWWCRRWELCLGCAEGSINGKGSAEWERCKSSPGRKDQNKQPGEARPAEASR